MKTDEIKQIINGLINLNIDENSNKPVPLEIDFKNIRYTRQKFNNKTVYESLKNNKIDLSNINFMKFERTLNELNLSKKDFLKKCQEDDYFCKLSSIHLSKCSSRQGIRDELEQLKACNFTAKKYGILIEKMKCVFLQLNYYSLCNLLEIKSYTFFFVLLCNYSFL